MTDHSIAEGSPTDERDPAAPAQLQRDAVSPTLLYHYTCEHYVRDILWKARGTLRPLLETDAERVFVLPVVWLTDVDVNSAEDAATLGFAPRPEVTCDRTSYRFIVNDLQGVQSWLEWAKLHNVSQIHRAQLEVDGSDPSSWWVSEHPVQAIPDVEYRFRTRSQPWRPNPVPEVD